jgi:hypothetical protein
MTPSLASLITAGPKDDLSPTSDHISGVRHLLL